MSQEFKEMEVLQNQLKQLQDKVSELSNNGASFAGEKIRAPKPDFFEGKSSHAADLWMFQMEQYLFVTSTPVGDHVRVISSYLRGAALVWWRRFYTERGAWMSAVEFKAEFLNHFMPIEAAESARSHLDSLRQTRSVEEYIEIFMRQAQLIPNAQEGELIHSFIRGLKKDIISGVALLRPKSLHEAMNLATRSDMVNRMFGGSSSSSSSSFSSFNSHASSFSPYRMESPSAVSSYSYTPMELGLLENDTSLWKDTQTSVMEKDRLFSREEYDRLRRERRCFKCKVVGHMARECRSSQ